MTTVDQSGQTDTRLDTSELGSQKFRREMGHISRQSSVFLAGTIFSLVAGYLFKVYLARVLGAELLGIYALGMTLVRFFEVFNSLGLPQSAVRFVASYTASGKIRELGSFLLRATGTLVITNIVFGGVLLVAGRWISVHFYHSTVLTNYLPYFAAIMLITAMNAFSGRILAGYKRISRRTVVVNFVGTPTMMTVAVLLTWTGWGLRGYLLGQVSSATVVIALLVILVVKYTPAAAWSMAARKSPVDREVWSFSGVILVLALMNFLLAQADKVTLGVYRSAREVGIYAMAAALVAYTPIILQSVNEIFAPTIADLYTRGEHVLLDRLFQTLTKWVLALTVPLATLLIVFASPLMRVFGREFEMGWPVLVFGAIAQLVNCGVGSVGYLLLMSGNQNRLLKVQLSMGALAVLLNIVLVPFRGVVGAAIASAIGTGLSNLWYLREVRTTLGLWPYNRSYLKLVAPAAATALGLLCLRIIFGGHDRNIPVLIFALASSYALFLGIFLSLGLNTDDRMIVGTVLSKVRDLFAS